MTNLEVILLIFLISFIVLIVLLSVMFCMTVVALRSFRQEVKELDTEVKGLIHNVNTVTVDVHKKMQYFDPLLTAIANVGKGLDVKACQYRDRQYTAYQKRPEEGTDNTMADFVKLALMGVNVWLSMRKRSS